MRTNCSNSHLGGGGGVCLLPWPDTHPHLTRPPAPPPTRLSTPWPDTHPPSYQTPPPSPHPHRWQTDACENITFPLRYAMRSLKIEDFPEKY